MSQTMEGIRILEVAEHTFVPAASAVLADWGADVIKVEHAVRGDAMRGLARTGVMDLSQGVHVLNEHSNRGKRSIGIDLANPEGLEVLYALAKTSDVFLTNKRPASLAKLRIDVEDLRRHNPDIVYVRGTAYGPKGPDGERGGYDMTGFWCRAGNASAITPPDLGRVLGQPGPAYGDSIGGMTIAGGIAAALLRRERGGGPSVVDVSLLSTGMWAMSAGIAVSLQMGVPWKISNVESAAGNPLVGTFETSDGRYICLVMLQAFHYWPDFCRHVGRDEWIDDPRFDSHESLTANSAVARELVAGEIARRPLAEWTERFQTLAGQWTVVQDTLEVVADPQTEANGYVQTAHTSAGTPFQLVSSPVQFDGEPAPTARAPEFNEHGDAILAELGLDTEKILALKTNGAVT